MRSRIRYLVLAIIIIATFGIIYFMTQKNIDGTVNFFVMLSIVLITDEYYLKRFNESKLKFICKSYIWVFIISLGIYLIYNSFRGALIYDIRFILILLTFLVLSTMIIYLIFYSIAYFINIFYKKITR